MMIEDDSPSDEWTTGRARVGGGTEIAEIRRLYASGQIEAALALAETVRASARLPLTAVPVVIVTQQALLKLPLDHRAGFMLTRIDGVSNIQQIIDISAMPVDQALTLLEKLITVGALGLASPVDDATLEKPPRRPERPKIRRRET